MVMFFKVVYVLQLFVQFTVALDVYLKVLMCLSPLFCVL